MARPLPNTNAPALAKKRKSWSREVEEAAAVAAAGSAEASGIARAARLPARAAIGETTIATRPAGRKSHTVLRSGYAGATRHSSAHGPTAAASPRRGPGQPPSPSAV